MDDVRYPIGQFRVEGSSITADQIQAWIRDVEDLPVALWRAVAGLTAEQLNTPYRPGGWTVLQVVHHLADAHLNNYVRFKLALTEEHPPIKSWDQQLWAELHDARVAPVAVSLALFEAVHQRWAILLRSTTAQDFARGFQHPTRGILTLDWDLGLYVWHGRHHTAHISGLRERMGW